MREIKFDPMELKWVFNGRPERIPQVGQRLEIRPNVLFEVEGYGEIKTTKDSFYNTGELSEIILKGHFVIPAGAPMKVIEEVLNGRVNLDTKTDDSD